MLVRRLDVAGELLAISVLLVLFSWGRSCGDPPRNLAPTEEPP